VRISREVVLPGDIEGSTADVEDYIAGLEEPRRTEIRRLHELIRRAEPELEPHIASKMIGYGSYHYRYASGREGDTFVVALANNKRYISLYVTAADDRGYVAERYRDKLPKADIGRSCVRLRRLGDVDEAVLVELIVEGRKVLETRR